MGHVQSNNVGSGTRSGTSNAPPLQAGLKCLTHTKLPYSQFVYSIIRHSNEGRLIAAKLEHLLTIITWLYRGLIFLPINVTYFLKIFSNILFHHELNSVFVAESHSLENLSILENVANTWPHIDRLTVRVHHKHTYV